MLVTPGRTIIACAIALAAALPAWAAGLSTEVGDVDASKFPEVSTSVTVFSEAGRPVPGLTKDDFTLSEDGTAVTDLHVEVSTAPCTVALVVDTSGSMGSAITDLKAGAAQLLRELRAEDEATLISFSDRPRLHSEDFTRNRRRLLDALEPLESAGATALYDALDMALREFRSRPGRRFLVVFTDGQDQNAKGTAPQSVATAKQVVLAARAQRVPIFTIGLGAGVNRELLAKMSRATGGVTYHTNDATKLTAAFTQALSDFRQQYAVAFKTPKPAPDGAERVLTVVSRSRGAEGQGTARYRAPPPPPPPPPTTPASPLTAVAGVARPYANITVEGFDCDKAVSSFVRIHNMTPAGWSSRDWKSLHLTRDRQTRLYTVRTQLPVGDYQIRLHPYNGDLKVNLYEFVLKVTGKEDFVVSPRGAQSVAPSA